MTWIALFKPQCTHRALSSRTRWSLKSLITWTCGFFIFVSFLKTLDESLGQNYTARILCSFCSNVFKRILEIVPLIRQNKQPSGLLKTHTALDKCFNLFVYKVFAIYNHVILMFYIFYQFLFLFFFYFCSFALFHFILFLFNFYTNSYCSKCNIV